MSRPQSGDTRQQSRDTRPQSRDTRPRGGFSIIELVMALIVLAFGVVGLATTTLFITRQLTLAGVSLSSTPARVRDGIGRGARAIALP